MTAETPLQTQDEVEQFFDAALAFFPPNQQRAEAEKAHAEYAAMPPSKIDEAGNECVLIGRTYVKRQLALDAWTALLETLLR